MSKCIDCRAPMSDFDAPKRVESEREPWEATRELEGTIQVEREGGE